MAALAAPLQCSASRARRHAARVVTRCAAPHQRDAAPRRAESRGALVLLPLAALFGSVVLASSAPVFAAVDSGCAKSCFKECIALAPKSEAYCKDNCDGACDSSAKDAPRDE